MGADLCLSWVPKCELTDERLEIARQRIRSATTEELMAVYPNFPEQAGDIAEEEQEAIEAYRAELLHHLDELLTYERRDAVSIRIEGAAYEAWIAGGMTWGDPPSEAFTTLSAINDFDPLYQLLREWALADEQTQRGNNAS